MPAGDSQAINVLATGPMVKKAVLRVQAGAVAVAAAGAVDRQGCVVERGRDWRLGDDRLLGPGRAKRDDAEGQTARAGHAASRAAAIRCAVAGRGVVAAAAVAVQLGEERTFLIKDDVVLFGVGHGDGGRRAAIGITAYPKPFFVDQGWVGHVRRG